jgi:hypothetical protein
MTESIAQGDQPGWRLRLVACVDAPLSQLALLTGRLTASAPADVRERLRALLEVVTQVYTRALDGAAAMSPRDAARLRAAGAAWVSAGVPLDDILGHLGDLTTCLVRAMAQQDGGRRVADPAPVIAAGNLLLREFLAGAAEPAAPPPSHPCGWSRKPADLVPRLIEGAALPADVEPWLAPLYVVVVLRAGDCGSAPASMFAGFGPETLVAAGPGGDVVALVPDETGEDTRRVARELGRRLPEHVWGAVVGRARTAIPAGYREAVDMLALARATGSEPGVYGRDDFLLEYAVIQHDVVADHLAAIAEPLMANSLLRETLEALIRADRNRSKAAKDLFIHRSTLDYRLQQIEKVTGRSPMTGRGAQLLSMAMTVHSLRRSSGAPG